MALRTLALLVLLCCAPTFSARAADLEALVGKVVEAYGGAEALGRVVSVRQTGQVRARIRHAGQAGELTRLFEGAERLRVEIIYPDGENELRIVDGGKGWRNGQPAMGPSLVAMKTQGYRLALPQLLIEHRDELVDRGEAQSGDASVRVLELGLPQGVALSVEIDPETHRIVRTRARFGEPPMVMEFATEYADFRRVEGVLFAFAEKNYASGRYAADTVLTSVELLDEQPAERFAPGPSTEKRSL